MGKKGKKEKEKKAKKALKKAFKLQNEGAGFTFVEILSNCPTGWGLTPEASLSDAGSTRCFPPHAM